MILPWLGVLVNQWTLSLWRLELLRISRYVFALSFAPTAALLAGGLASRRITLKAIAALVLMALIILSRPELWYVGYLTSRSETALAATGRAEEEIPLDLDGIRDVAEWARVNTPTDALFLAPVDWALFSVYGQRSLVATAKASWAAPNRYLEVKALYEERDADALAEAAEAYGADYVVVVPGLRPPGWRLAYENELYAVFAEK
jgi:hypothetical protein